MNRKITDTQTIKPNFLIVGAAKAGTTSLYAYLKQHPAIFMPRWKELSLLIGDPYGPLHQVKKEKYYYQVFIPAKNEKAIGEASTSYLFDPDAPRLIKEKLGMVRIVIVLRDPVSMAYSLYNHQLRKEGETITSFERALSAERLRYNDPGFRKRCYGWHANYYYFLRGLYYHQVKRYLTTFGQENVLIHLFDDLVRDPVAVSQRTYHFLGVDKDVVPEIKIHNPGGRILSIPRFWEDAGLRRKTASFIFSVNPLKKMPLLLKKMGMPPPAPLNPRTGKMLREKFINDISGLEKLIQRDLSAWKVDST